MIYGLLLGTAVYVMTKEVYWMPIGMLFNITFANLWSHNKKKK